MEFIIGAIIAALILFVVVFMIKNQGGKATEQTDKILDGTGKDVQCIQDHFGDQAAIDACIKNSGQNPAPSPSSGSS